jgi:integrase/recombinase XerD
VDKVFKTKRTLQSLRTRNWEVAMKRVLKMETEGDKAPKTIREATDSFIRDAEARGLRPPSIYKYRLLFKQLNAFADEKGLTFLSECDVDMLRQFRESWLNKNYSARKKLEALRTFYRFVYESGWLNTNPATKIASPKVNQPPTMPYTRDEFNRVLAACDKYPNEKHPNTHWGSRLKALVLLLRHSGLRISDAVTLSKHQLKDGVLILRTAKTGTDVRVPLPSEVVLALDAVKQPNGHYFWSGLSTKKSCVGDYQRAFKKLYKLAKVENGHAHRWRDTFAVELLLAGVSLSDVSILLGHQSIKVTEKHYSPWVKARQEQLEATVRAAQQRYNSDTSENQHR